MESNLEKLIKGYIDLLKIKSSRDAYTDLEVERAYVYGVVAEELEELLESNRLTTLRQEITKNPPKPIRP